MHEVNRAGLGDSVADSGRTRMPAVRRRLTAVLLAVLLVLCSTAALPAASVRAADDTSAVEFFERSVRPILAKRCFECHSSETGPENGGLVLDQPAGIAAGGSRGSLIQASGESESLLLRAVRYVDVGLQMPPAGRMPPEELAVLERWVQDGAALPEYTALPRPERQSIDFAAARDFWSLRPVAPAAVPDTGDDPWAVTEIDAFLLADLKRKQLAPSIEADRRTLLRRLFFDVIGLPPSPDELAAFCEDRAVDNWQRTVDRLLASPHYGERWARMWLDLARYTDFTPDWQNPTDRGWMYRDWVVQALNQNRPYDEFVRLQLAADLIPETAPEDQAALGFLGLSPTYWKELRLAPPVIEQIVADEWDERIDAVSRTFLGLTVSCARCHDHKFDPISTKDYYALAGIFASTQLDERPLLPPEQAAAVTHARQQVDQLQQRLKQLRAEKSTDTESVEQQIAEIKRSVPGFDTPFAHVVREASIYVLPEGDELTRLDYRENEARNLPVFRRGNPANPGEVVPRRYLQVFEDGSPILLTEGSGRRQLAEAILNQSQGLVARVIVNRIWAGHFGAGLVATSSDFGLQGDRPTHPELMEFLAYQLVARGWDLKWLHRQILMSSAYRQSSVFREDAFAVDPDNELLWRMNRRRLDIEMWRDAMLSVSNRLDRTMGGPSRPVDDLNNVRRTLYVTVAREELNPMLRMHDFPEASAHSPRREPTTTPLQQLFFLNSGWIEQQASALWGRLQPLNSDQQRLETAYLLLFSRLPDESERRIGLRFVSTDAEKRWQDYLQALLGLNEFHFVD